MPGTSVSSIRPFLLAVFCIAVSALPVLAQIAAGEITGVIKDQAGEAVPGVTVTVTEVSTDRQRVVISSTDGVYTVSSLAPGAYRIDVELARF